MSEIEMTTSGNHLSSHKPSKQIESFYKWKVIIVFSALLNITYKWQKKISLNSRKYVSVFCQSAGPTYPSNCSSPGLFCSSCIAFFSHHQSILISYFSTVPLNIIFSIPLPLIIVLSTLPLHNCIQDCSDFSLFRTSYRWCSDESLLPLHFIEAYKTIFKGSRRMCNFLFQYKHNFSFRPILCNVSIIINMIKLYLKIKYSI